MRLFREQVSDFIDRPKIKFSIGLFFVAVIAGSFIGAVFAKNAAKDEFCLSRNCTDSQINTQGDQIALGVGMGVMLFGMALVAAMSFLILCCFSETTGLDDYDVQQRLASDSDLDSTSSP